MVWRYARLAFLMPAFLLLASPSGAQEFPGLTGRVVDAAGLLSPATEASIEQKLARLEAETTRQLVVVTVPDLQDYPIEDYGYRLGRAWGVGQKDEDNGALLIVAPNEKKVRVEVGYGLEGYLTDALSSIIIQRAILPRFKAGDLEGGIVAGTDALVSQLALPPGEARANLVAARAQKPEANGNGFGLVPALFLIWFIVWILRGVFGGRRYRRRAGPWGIPPVIIWGPGTGHGRGGFGGGFGGGGFSGGGGGFGGGGASGSW